MPDNLEQKIDRLTVMMGKLVTEDEDTRSHLRHKYISPIEVGIKIEVTFMADLEIMHIGDAHCTIKL